MIINVDNVVYGEDLMINGNLTKGATGNVTIILDNDKKYTVHIVDGKFHYTITELINAGTHKITVKYDGDEKYSPVEVNKTISIAKAESKLEVKIKDVNYGEILDIKATLTSLNNTPLNGNIM